MRPRPDGSVSSLSRHLMRFCPTAKVYGTLPLGDGFAVSVAKRRGRAGSFLDLRIVVAGNPTRRGLALWPDEVAVVAAMLARAAHDIGRGNAASIDAQSGKEDP